MSWLRFFQEDHPELAVVAAGSLLEVRLADRGFSYPVGRVTLEVLRPFSFLEFLSAVGQDGLATTIRQAHAERRPLLESIHAQALEHLTTYVIVGGMPEAVHSWSEHASEERVRRIQDDLLQAFAEDFQRYARARDLDSLTAAFDSLPLHYGRRFKYEGFAPGHKSLAMKTAIEKLEGAMLVQRVLPTTALSTPFHTKPRSAPKLLPLDVGLALRSLGLDGMAMRSTSLDSLLDGRIAESLVGTQLLAGRPHGSTPMRFWVRDDPRSNAEVDYVLAAGPACLPVEVKAGAAGSLKSLHQFLHRSRSRRGVRLWSNPLVLERHEVKMENEILDYELLSLPLYMAELLRPDAPPVE